MCKKGLSREGLCICRHTSRRAHNGLDLVKTVLKPHLSPGIWAQKASHSCFSPVQAARAQNSASISPLCTRHVSSISIFRPESPALYTNIHTQLHSASTWVYVHLCPGTWSHIHTQTTLLISVLPHLHRIRF